jgi:hypothetical protein
MKHSIIILLVATALQTTTALAASEPLPEDKPRFENLGGYYFEGRLAREHCEQARKEASFCGFFSEYKCTPCTRQAGDSIMFFNVLKKLK